MGLLSRLAKIGSGIVRKTLASASVPDSEEAEIEPPRKAPTSTLKEEEMTPAPSRRATPPPLVENLSRSDSEEDPNQNNQDTNVQSTQRDGHRRSL